MKKKDHLMLFILIITIVFGVGYTSRASTLDDKLIKQRIQSDAADKIRLRETKVNLAVEDGYVVLFGTVDLYIQKMLYEQIAWKTEGVIEVDNEIRVVPGLPQTDAVIERKIMKVVRTYDRLKGLTITVAVKTGVVNIRIILNHPSDVLFLKRKVAEIDGVISINIRAKFFAYLPVFTNRCYVSEFLPLTPGTIQNIHFA